jgi:hypothetical protein
METADKVSAIPVSRPVWVDWLPRLGRTLLFLGSVVGAVLHLLLLGETDPEKHRPFARREENS